MKRHRNRVFLGLALCAALLPGELKGEGSGSPDDQDIVRSEAIDSGYVILDGAYLSPPYVLEKHGDDLWVNEHLATADWFVRHTGMRGRGGGGGRSGRREGPPDFGGPRGRRMPPSEPKFGLRQLENTLKDNGMLIVGEGLRGLSLGETQAAMVVEALMSGNSQEEKLQQIRDDVPHRLDEADWQRLVETFEPSDELIERIGPEIERVQQTILDNEAHHQAALASVFWNSQPVKYVITLVAMGLVVAACGTLLNYRPIGRARWSDVDANGDGIPIVVRSVVLLVLLGIFDLGCTLVAQQAGGFAELNPLGSQLIENPALLTTFKLTTLLVACGILLALRRYRGAQLASWWMCLLCTVLTFRWLTYNSMFMG